MGLWQRLTQRGDDQSSALSPTRLERDPDLDRYHHEQHELMNQTGYVAARTRDTFNERLRESWQKREYGAR